MSYWIYQHLGNLSPAELAKNELWQQMQEPGDQAGPLGDFAAQADQLAADIQWSYRRTFGGVRIVVIDSRSGRVLEEGRRRMVGEAEWQWVTESVAGDWNHVVLATSLPLLLPYGIHGLEAWNEAVCGGAWGQRLARAGERIRRELDLEHWAAFGASFGEFEELLTGLATGAYGRPPASVTVLGGDIHHSYLAAVDFPRRHQPPQRRLPGGLLADPQRAAGPVPARAAADHLTPGRHGRPRHRPAGRSAQAADPVADHPRPLVPQHALRPRVRWPPGADPLRPHRLGPIRHPAPPARLRSRAQLTSATQPRGPRSPRPPCGQRGRGIPQVGPVRGDVGRDAGQRRVRGQRRQPPSVPQPDRDLAGRGLPPADDRLVGHQP